MAWSCARVSRNRSDPHREGSIGGNPQERAVRPRLPHAHLHALLTNRGSRFLTLGVKLPVASEQDSAQRQRRSSKTA